MTLPTGDVVIDNGAFEIKLLSSETGTVLRVPNCLAKAKGMREPYVGPELARDTNNITLGFRRAHELGYLVNWEVERWIWDTTFSEKHANIHPPSLRLLLTEAPFNLQSLQANTDEMIFDYYLFDTYLRCLPASFVPWGDLPLTSSLVDNYRSVVLVIDSGFSFTHIIPVVNAKPLIPNIKRVNIGGKFLTNALKEVVSFRHYNMMEETHLINQIKEQCCFVSNDFKGDMEKAKKGILKVNYVLPDLLKGHSGFVAEPEAIIADDQQLLTLSNELFTIPELLFRPSDIGMRQTGVVDTVMQSLSGLSDGLKALLLENVVLVGGNVKFPGFKERFETELRAVSPDEFDVNVYMPDDPTTYACECGMSMARNRMDMTDVSVSKSQFKEMGKRATAIFKQESQTGKTGNVSIESYNPTEKESKYVDSVRSDTPRSFSPDTEPEQEGNAS